MGGNVNVSSVLGDGAEFKINLNTKSNQKINYKI